MENTDTCAYRSSNAVVPLVHSLLNCPLTRGRFVHSSKLTRLGATDSYSHRRLHKIPDSPRRRPEEVTNRSISARDAFDRGTTALMLREIERESLSHRLSSPKQTPKPIRGRETKQAEQLRSRIACSSLSLGG